jgi:hypothetical protein
MVLLILSASAILLACAARSVPICSAVAQKVQQIVHWPRPYGYADIEYGRERAVVAQDLLGVACMVKRSSPPCMISS